MDTLESRVTGNPVAQSNDLRIKAGTLRQPTRAVRHRAEIGTEMRHGNRFLRRFGAKLGLAALMVGCAGPAAVLTGESPAADKEKAVAQRAEVRWAALIKGDLDSAYSYLSSGSKAATSLALYKSRMKPGLWREAKVAKVTCEGEICQVGVQITYDAPRMKGIQTLVPENWIIENGTAWYVYR